MKSGLMVSWAKRCFSSSVAQLAVLLLMLLVAGAAQAVQTLTVTPLGTGTGSVASAPAGISCGATCSYALFADNTNVTLTATADPGSVFAGWSGVDGAACGSLATCTVAMGTAAKSVSATFSLVGILTVETKGTGAGGVHSITTAGVDTGGIDCGTDAAQSDCFEIMMPVAPANIAVITLRATAAADSTFVGWSGSCSGTGLCVIVSGGSVTAEFSGPTLYVSEAGAGAGQITSVPTGINCHSPNACSKSYNRVTSTSVATDVSLTATPDIGSSFNSATGWSGCDSVVSGQCKVRMSTMKNVTATFTLGSTNGPYTLTVVKVGNGSVASSSGAISCGTSCTDSYASGTMVTLTATPDAGDLIIAGNTFTGWSGADAVLAGCTGTGPCIVTMSAAKTITATFISRYTLKVTLLGTGSGSVSSNPGGIACGSNSLGSPCSAAFDGDSDVILTATPDPTAGLYLGSGFAGWGGDCSGSALTCTVRMSKVKNVTAIFNIDPSGTQYALTVLKAGSGIGIVKSDPTGIDCGTTCSHTYGGGSVVALTASTPSSGNTFVGWGGDCSGTGTCIVSMSTVRNVIATFNSVATSSKKTLYLYKLGTGSGAVTSDPAGIDCPPSGCSTTSASFDSGAAVILTATHAQGSTFTGWSGGGSDRAVNSVVVNGAAKTVTLTLASAVLTGQNVTVAYTDPTTGNDGNAIQDIYGTDTASVPVSSVTNRTGAAADTTTPNFALATVNGNTLTMSYTDASYNLDTAKIPATNAFTVKVDNIVATVSSVQVIGAAKTVLLTLATAVAAGQSVNLAYSAPSASPIQDAHGNVAASLGETTVSNLTGAPPGTLPPVLALASVNGDQLVLSYVGPADLDATNLPSLGRFAVQVGALDSCIGTATTCQVIMSAGRTVTAIFDGASPAFFTVHIGKLGTGTGSIKTSGISLQDPINCGTDCDGSFTLGTPVVLKAFADANSNFDGWESGCKNTPSKNEDCYVLKTKVDIEKDGTSYGVTVIFTEAVATTDFRTLWVTKQGAGTGSITSTSSAPNLLKQKQVDCGGTCTVDYLPGTTVTLTASPGAPAFTGWKGACVGLLTTCTLTMESGKSVIATFIPSVTASLVGSGHGVVTSQPSGINCGSTCSAVFAGASSAILTATPNTGSVFTGWAGPCTGSALACTVGTSVTQSVTATFSLANPLAAKPSAPVIATAKPGPASALISFAAPASIGSAPLIGYEARCQTANLSPVVMPGAASPIIVRKLTPRAPYLCSVTAINSVGASPASETKPVTPQANSSINSILMLLLD